MALKSDREIYQSETRFICNTTGEAGALLKFASQGSGQGVGQGLNGAAPIATTLGTGTPSGIVIAGVLLGDVFSLDESRYHRNFHQPYDQKVNENVELLTDGKLWTNMITGTPAAGDPAYPAANGNVGTTQPNSLPKVGKFLTSKDANGYALVHYQIQ